MPNPITNFRDSNNADLGNILITKEYLMSVYPQIANQIITPELWIWGANSANSWGRMGDNTTTLKCTPVTTFAGGANWKLVSCGTDCTASIKTDGTLWIWGNGSTFPAILGNFRTVIICTPVTTFAGGTNWKQVACGTEPTAAIKTDGTLWVWGSGLGLGITANLVRCTPVTTFAGGTNWKQVSCGLNHTAAIKTDGTLWIWGINTSGKIGHNATNNPFTPVTTFAGGTNWKQVSCGREHTAAIKTDGTLWTWGRNTQGQLGVNDTTSNRTTPVTTFAGGTNWKQVACGGYFIAAIKTDGTLWTWGQNLSSQLGINTFGDRPTPVTTFTGGTNWKQVSAGSANTAAIKTDGTLWIWGSGTSGQLGNNTTNSSSNTAVTTFAGGTDWKQVSMCTVGNGIAAIKTSDNLQGI